jgi:hypothetical protein
MNKFELGEIIDLSMLSENEARLIVGRTLYESWKNSSKFHEAMFRVKQVNWQERTIIVEWEEPPVTEKMSDETLLAWTGPDSILGKAWKEIADSMKTGE